jgi:RNA polymerase sigma-70 factor (ECF subfamily)
MSDARDRGGARPGLRLVTAATASERSDEALVRAFLAGDDEAFGELVRRHERTVLALLRRYTEGSPAGFDAARDLAQQAFLRAFQAARRSSWRRAAGPDSFRAWLFRVAVNLGRNHARDTRRWRRAPVEAAEVVPVWGVGTAELERAERERAVRAAVLNLPQRQRDVLTLRIDADLSFREIAGVLGLTEGNARVHFHHAARRLRDAVARVEGP